MVYNKVIGLQLAIFGSMHTFGSSEVNNSLFLVAFNWFSSSTERENIAMLIIEIVATVWPMYLVDNKNYLEVSPLIFGSS